MKTYLKTTCPLVCTIAVTLGIVFASSNTAAAVNYPSKASSKERKALDRLASEIEGEYLFTRKGRVRKITIGDWQEQDLGKGDFVRWGPLGKRIAVLHDDRVFVMNADGSDRKKLVDGVRDGGRCPIDFHPNGREILYGRRKVGVWSVDIISGKKRDLKIPFETELSISADGQHFVGRRGDCYLVELPRKKSRKFSGGCSPCVSPDGKLMASNKGDHRTMDIQKWNGKRLFKINAKEMRPDRRWDNMHWSNHHDYIAMQGDGRIDEAYVFRISKRQSTRLSWQGRTEYPDLFIHKDRKTGEIPMQRTLAWAETQGNKIATTKAPKLSKPEHSPNYKDWPGDQRDLVFLWENNRATNQIEYPNGKSGRLCQAVARGHAVFGRFYEMDLSGGAVLAQDVDTDLLKACQRSNELTIEATVTPESATHSGPAHIVSFSKNSAALNFMLGQEQDQLVLKLVTSRKDSQPLLDLCKVRPGQTYHIVVTYQSGQLTCYVNGKQTLHTDRVLGNFSNWEPMHLLFGDDWDSGQDWGGQVEGVTIYARALSAAEAQQKHKLYAPRLKQRESLSPLVVRGKLLEITPIPKVKDLKEYSRGMVVFSYEVREVLEGSEQEKNIQVAHWTVLDRELLPEIGRKKIGQVYKLQLENFDKHPQLESERIFNDCEDFDAPLYYDVMGRGVANTIQH